MKIGAATKALLRSLTPAARTLLRHMVGRRFPIDPGTAAEETGIAPNAANAAMRELHHARLVDELTQPTEAGPQPAGIYEVTSTGRRIGQLIRDQHHRSE